MSTEKKGNRAAWLAFLLALAAIGVSAGFLFVAVPGEIVLAWISLLLSVAALVWGVMGVRRAFGQPQVYGGKVIAPIFAVIALLVCGLMGFGWFSARNLPASGGAPQVGQKAPDFTLSDTNGKQVSLNQLLTSTQNGANNAAGQAAPKSVLLIFYRGYW